jgi:hypothetical protein
VHVNLLRRAKQDGRVDRFVLGLYLGLGLGLGPVAAGDISNWLLESFVHYAAEALAQDPDVAGFADWIGVTSCYSIAG